MLRMHLWNSENKDINRISVMLYVQMPEILELCKQIKEKLKEADLYEFGPHHVIWLGKWFLTWTKMDLLDTSFGPKSGAALSREGGFGDVYKGQSSKIWQHCTSAIKCLNRKGAQGKEEFHNEMIIVNEYGSNGSLDGYLEDTNKRRNLTWVHRLRIWHQVMCTQVLRMPAQLYDTVIMPYSLCDKVIPKRIIFYRHGVTDDQFYHVIFYELLAIYEAYAVLWPNCEPLITFGVVQKRKHTVKRLSGQTDVKCATALSGLLFMRANSWNQCILDANIYWQSFMPVYLFKEDLDHGVLLVGYGSAGYVPSRLKEKPMKIFFELRKQKYLEALDRQVYNPLFLWHVIGGVWNDRAKAVEILVKDLKNARVMVLAATNRPSELDEAILRRLPQAFEIGAPDYKERAAILKVILKDESDEDDIDLDFITALCEGYTGSDLLELCKKAAYFPIKDLLNEEKKGKSSPMSIFLSHLYIIIDMVAHSSEFENIFVRDEEQNKLETLVRKVCLFNTRGSIDAFSLIYDAEHINASLALSFNMYGYVRIR
ncbi:ATPase family AAA domain-containing protein 1-B-like protein [Tanacetum coccineum]